MTEYEVKSAAVQLLGGGRAEVRVLTVDNELVSIVLRERTLYALARRVADLCDPRDWPTPARTALDRPGGDDQAG